ncbi:YopX family protein [Staphylococcus gallinarum]|jgi:uncharacterized phage protein (TIGR01671 family)|uniref:YopX family protein n=1 Tax=Staphylococcus gallinarum TaxID=1293 RepID=UPI000D1CB1ED|nr:YopX family protein [Staphylococcus gallinarum]MCQ9288746.1 YopX family protein [Staphylococcus gallinarum]PTE36547.1 hypothetical protein BUZ00_04825 [Staphylococcus gallinarum]
MIPKFRCFIDGIGIVGVKAIYFDSEQIILEPLNGVENNYIALEEVELMQSTGLKDKNNVEIFEGDIVKVQAEDTEPKMRADRYEIGVIIYSYGSFDIETKPNTVSGLIPESNLTDIRLTLEVIGNQFEHPHLLQE